MHFVSSLMLALLLIAAPVNAHQQKAAFSQVLLNPRTQMLEISHRFLLHDAEHAVQMLFDSRADIIANDETQRRFAEYVAHRFTITTEQGKPLDIALVGFEIERSFIWVYQETPPPITATSLIIHHSALFDIWPDQENMVNVEGLGALKTLYFKPNKDGFTIDLE